ncbi:hypothetical protein IL306_008366 [Fusarium sp. DS 682]|nr:hypothetical protein IL306_008366 [Fusarium sp. DS 682]
MEDHKKAKRGETPESLQQTDERGSQVECQGANDFSDGHGKEVRMKAEEGEKENQVTDPEAS